MPSSNRGRFENPAKSAYNFEVYDSGPEQRMMRQLEGNPNVRKWTKKHGITISWIDSLHNRHTYRPDFLVEYTDGGLALIEVKGKHLVDTEAVKRKRSAAEYWCKQRGMTYEMAVA